jgi:hypothetical protein
MAIVSANVFMVELIRRSSSCNVRAFRCAALILVKTGPAILGAAGSSGTHTHAATGSAPGSAEAESGHLIIVPEDDNSATSTAAGSAVQEAAGTAGEAAGTAAVPNGQAASALGGNTAAESSAISVSGNNPALIHINQPNEAADEAAAPEAAEPGPELAPANDKSPTEDLPATGTE